MERVNWRTGSSADRAAAIRFSPSKHMTLVPDFFAAQWWRFQ